REGGQPAVQAGAMTTHGAYDDQSALSAPVPVPGCAVCDDLATRRHEARARRDGSAETDADVLLRRHRRQEHADRHRRGSVVSSQ
ncbi:MAG: hypothetical protein LBV34_24480, partial [Nocardiopsaceae bacterium]|nr:hypothetical protein [Nocardiopsaceae bacterium]